MEEANDFFTQRLFVSERSEHSWEYCKMLSVNQKVLHIGCSDWPIFNPNTNMHIYLKEFAKELVGVDINGIDAMQKHCPGRYFSSIEDIASSEEWDTILVPNIIEHLENPGDFIEQLMKLKYKRMFAIVPNAKVYEQSEYDGRIFKERVHPDHYAWYSPYTFHNLFKKHLSYGSHLYSRMMFFDNQNMIAIEIIYDPSIRPEI